MSASEDKLDNEVAPNNISEAEALFSLASSPTPGLPFTDPYLGLEFFRKGNVAIVKSPDLSEEKPDFFQSLGEFESEPELVKRIAEFVDSEGLEIPLAVFCHHSPIPPDEFPIWSSLPQFFWLSSSPNAMWLVEAIDDYLLRSSALYQALVRAVSENPEDPEAILEFSLEDSMDFTSFYLEFRGL